MDCSGIQDILRSGGRPDTPEAQAHRETCGACRVLVSEDARLVGALDSLDLPTGNLDSMLADLTGRLERERGLLAWLRSRSTQVRVGLVGALGAVMALLALALTPRADLAVYPISRMALVVVGLTALATWTITHGLRPLHRPPRTTGWAILALALMVPMALALLPVAHAAHPASLEGAGDDFLRRAMACFLFGAITGLPVLVLARFVDRRAHTNRVSGLLAAALAGLVGNLALQFHCPITHLPHLLVGHAAVGLGLVPVYGLLLLVRTRLKQSGSHRYP